MPGIVYGFWFIPIVAGFFIWQGMNVVEDMLNEYKED